MKIKVIEMRSNFRPPCRAQSELFESNWKYWLGYRWKGNDQM